MGEEVMKDINANAPPGVSNGYQTADSWPWFKTLNSLVNTTIIGLAIGLSLGTFVILVFTHNLIISGFAILTIACIINSILGFITMNGRKFGLIEAVSVTVMIGISVDYVLHLGVAHTESKSDTRKGRIRFCLTSLGMSVFSGAVTTFLAILPMFSAELLLLVRFAEIFIFAIVMSFYFSHFLFVPLLSVMGPITRTQGDYFLSIKKCINYTKNKHAQNETELSNM